MTKKIDVELKEKIEVELEELWDWICARIGFDKKGKQVQQAIRKFVALKLKEYRINLTNDKNMV